MKKNVLITVVLVVLVLISVVQAVQLYNLKSEAAGGRISLGSSSQSAPLQSGQGVSSEKNLQNLPQMVGGC